MTSQNLSKKFPINIGIFQRYLSNDIFNDTRLIQLMDELNNKENIHKYNYAIYCDTNELKSNLFVPVFNTIYLSCSNNKVLIGNESDAWITQAFLNNDYYILENHISTNFDFTKINVKVIKHIKELGEI